MRTNIVLLLSHRFYRICLALLLGAVCLPLRAAPPAQASAPAAPAPPPSIDDGLVSYWPFEEGSGATSADYSGGNTVTIHSPAGFTNTTAPLDIGSSSAFKSILNPTSYATAPGTNIDTLQRFTIALWVRIDPGVQSSTKQIIALGNGKALINYTVSNGSGSLRFFVMAGHAQQGLLFPSYTLTPGAYYHLAIVFDGSFHSYINGEDRLNFIVNSSSDTGNGVAFSSPTEPLDGALDDVRIYNRGLSATEMARLAFNCGGVSQIPQAECHALADIFLNTNGMNWANHTDWLRNNTPCTWYGVLCNNGHVILLDLRNNGLNGTLPPSLNDLTGLVSLGLSGNNLAGPIPPLLNGLTQLQALDLSNNHLSGGLPALLGSLTNLNSLNLSANALSGDISPLITRLTKLTTLNISYNALNPTDSGVRAFLTTYQPNWAATQTVPPAGIQAKSQSPTSVALTWTPIPYTADGGYYEVLASKNTGLYTSVGKTADKSAGGITITGLQTGATYSFLVRTFTPKHSGQSNDVTSDTSDAVTATPTANQPPVAANDSYTTQQGTPLTVDAAHGLLANDSDPDGTPLKVGAISTASPGSKLALNLDGSFTYTPAPGFAGTETFTYQASDGQALSNQATVSFTVTAKSTTATITIALDVQPDSKTNFSFAGGLGAFLLDDITPQDGDAYDNHKTFTVPAGTYTVTEALPSGWSNANISCNPPANTIADLTKNQIVINAASGANITCTFVTQRTGQLIAGAYNDHNHNHVRNSNDQWLRGWQMQLRSGQSGQVTVQTTDLEGRTVFDGLRPGSYTICEVLVSGWFNITPGVSPPCYAVTVAPGQAVWARFGNSTTALLSSASVGSFSDIAICDLPATDDNGNPIAPARDPWEEEEAAGGKVLFLPLIVR